MRVDGFQPHTAILASIGDHGGPWRDRPILRFKRKERGRILGPPKIRPDSDGEFRV